MRRLGIPQVRISSYNSRANGVVERGHFTIRESIVKACEYDMGHWHRKVPMAFFADRISVSRVTGYSAYYLLHGEHPLLPLDLCDMSFLVHGFTSGMTSAELLALRIRQLERHEEDIGNAAAVLREARFRSKAQFERRFEKKLRHKFYQPGDLVIVRNSKIEVTLNKKHQPRYLGPFEVDRRTKGGSYVLKELDGTFIRKGVAAFRLYPYIDRNSPMLKKLSPMDEAFIDSDSEEEEDILL
ncbi:hypothetical protein FIBSPDRAFT_749873 [Athelia psychrophila]|uniref:Integrase catalytic domain-containing protein n=1 Tax=Athelia psychrophila TaxID=1759441 RepID=A0A166EC40_9AGAM|nr:hypothetical protein FIBSPDRAFT_749873 [Fibularhizoctonia sp. CBS 109695]